MSARNSPPPPDQELWVLFPGALNPTVKSLDKFLLFNENVVDPGSLTNFGVLPGFCGVLRNLAGAGSTRPGEVFSAPCVRGPRSPGCGDARTGWALAPPGGCPWWRRCACWPGSREAPSYSRSPWSGLDPSGPSSPRSSVLRPPSLPPFLWSDSAWCVCLLVCVCVL